MKEYFVSCSLAVKLKEKGFKEECIAHYFNGEFIYNISQFRGACVESLLVSYNSLSQTDNIYENYNKCIDAPSVSQVLKWLRKKKGLHIEIVSASYGYIYFVSDTPEKGGTDRAESLYRGKNDGGAWDDPDECVFDAIEYVIDNLI